MKGRVRASTTLALATAALAAVAAPAYAGNAPTVVAHANAVVISGNSAEMALDCEFTAKQAAAIDLVVDHCYTTNGVHATISTEPSGPMVLTNGVGRVTIQPFALCARAYSIDDFGVRSDVLDTCSAQSGTGLVGVLLA